ncbi:YdcF family protein [Neiella marina]|uniref:YdcF family protein n=1 Tax=Neiella holothuriorum TaxID=2870530 RepID=A0ABS7EHE5_9GAMM|nr:ElyC/SanA/YdcF family protein [Neiella holothuriorum]MBW8191766.1 YdcF family protein [Neiella holothuriorum]
MDFFTFKKLVGLIFAPMPIGAFLLTWALVVCWLQRSTNWLRWPLTISWLLLVGVTILPFISSWLIEHEGLYPAYSATDKRPVEEILVLGCYANDDPLLPITSQVHTCSRGRLVEALRIWQLHPNAQILLSGGAIQQGQVTQAEIGAQFLIALGLPKHAVRVVNQGHDTQSEAAAYRQLISSDMPVLVTSATHMKRAVRLFTQQGIRVIPAPSEHLMMSPSDQGEMIWQDLVPKPYYLYQIERVWYATLGNAWLTLQSLFERNTAEPPPAALNEQSDTTTDDPPAADKQPSD